MVHVMDADSSQAVAIEEVQRGRNLVDPRSAGDGQVADDHESHRHGGEGRTRTVLFVAEKMAALEVVKRRLDRRGPGRHVLRTAQSQGQQDERARGFGKDAVSRTTQDSDPARLDRGIDFHTRQVEWPCRDHAPTAAAITTHAVPCRLAAWCGYAACNVPPADFELIKAAQWTPPQRLECVNLLHDVSLHMRGIGVPADHPWRGVTIEAILPMDLDRLKPRLRALIERLDRLIAATNELAGELHAKIGDSATDASTVARLGQRLAAAPDMDRTSISDDVWRTRREEISSLLKTGQALYTCRLKLTGVVVESAWSVEVSSDATQPCRTRKFLVALV